MITTCVSYDIDQIVQHFQIDGQFLEAVPYGTGHINDTYASQFRTPQGVTRFIHQRINHKIFKEPECLMENIERVTGYAQKEIRAAGGDPLREALTLIPTLDGGSFYRDYDGNYWRSYLFIEGARTYDVVKNLRHVYSASHAFGKFQRLLSGLPGQRLHETIPHFHDTPYRYQTFLRAVERDAARRAHSCRAEIDFVQQRAAQMAVVVDGLADGSIPERVTHNDTKFNNVMIDDVSGAGVCVIDLDTVMPGSILYDFGDSVRIGASQAAEDEIDLAKVDINLEMFAALGQGYLDVMRDFLVPREVDLLAFSARLLTLECGMRFLTDYLSGDVYYKIHREAHNLDRCRTQFKMVAEMERKAEAMEIIVNRFR
jgi:hypothetical protein